MVAAERSIAVVGDAVVGGAVVGGAVVETVISTKSARPGRRGQNTHEAITPTSRKLDAARMITERRATTGATIGAPERGAPIEVR